MHATKHRKGMLVLIGLMLLTLLALAVRSAANPAERVSYPELLRRLGAGEVASVRMADSAALEAVGTDGRAFTFDNPRMEQFKHTLLMNGVAVTESGGAGLGYALLLAGMLAIGFLLMRGRRQSERGFARKIGHESESVVPTTHFADVAANEEAMESLRDLVSFIQSPERYSRFGARVPRGVLLHGMPGTGKTLMARALAGEAGVPFFAVNGADFVEMYVGVGASRVRALFQKARKAGRAVIFFDEIDAIGKRRDNQSDEREQTLNALLSEMSGFREGDGVVVLAATNRADTLDEALLRAGRFDRQIEVPLPGYEERVRILEVHARNKPLAGDVSLPEIAAQTALFSGAKLESMLNEAAILAAKRSAESITRDDVGRAMDTMLFGMERRNGAAERERELTAAHEAGHALLTAVLLPQSGIRKVSIIPTGRGAAGYSMSIPPERMFHSKQELVNHMAVALAGREAEALLLGAENVTTGAANDIEKACTLARRMVCEWGMLPHSEEAGLFSQAQKDAAAQEWLHIARMLAGHVLAARRAAWERLIGQLLAHESLVEQEVQACLAEPMAAAEQIAM
ncbi:MAG: AAA family ATPase [Clostridia bacterium]